MNFIEKLFNKKTDRKVTKIGSFKLYYEDVEP